MEITDLPKLRHALGDNLLVAFCRCFVWTDRLMSMNNLGLQVASLEATSVRFGRNVELRYSHLLPKASYRLLAKSQGGEAPVVMNSQTAISTNDQVRAHVFYEKCEDVLTRHSPADAF